MSIKTKDDPFETLFPGKDYPTDWKTAEQAEVQPNTLAQVLDAVQNWTGTSREELARILEVQNEPIIKDCYTTGYAGET